VSDPFAELLGSARQQRHGRRHEHVERIHRRFGILGQQLSRPRVTQRRTVHGYLHRAIPAVEFTRGASANSAIERSRVETVGPHDRQALRRLRPAHLARDADRCSRSRELRATCSYLGAPLSVALDGTWQHRMDREDVSHDSPRRR
jgi:hypothetical protein